MAIRGRKPKPDHLRLILGGKKPPQSRASFDGMERAAKPKGLPKAVAAVWDRTIARCTWLTWADEPKATMFCYLTAEFEASEGAMLSARIAQLRALGSELGLDPASRARLGVDCSPKEPDPLARFLEPDN